VIVQMISHDIESITISKQN